MRLPGIDNKNLSTVIIGIIAVAALYYLKLDAKEIVIAAVSAIGGAMAAKGI